MKKIKICILGTGFASIAYLPALNTINQVKINSIYGRNYSVLKKLSKKYKIQNIYTDIKDLLNNCNDDLYCNVLPPKQQFDYSKKILRRKKNQFYVRSLLHHHTIMQKNLDLFF